MIIKISRDTASQLYATRSLTGYDRKTKKSAIIAKIKSDNGISRQTKLRINILNEDDPMFLVVRDKRSNQPLSNNLPEPVIAIVPGAVAEAASTPAVKTQPEAASTPAVKTQPEAASTPAVKTQPEVVSKPASKVPAKKPVAKTVAKKAPAVSKVPAKKAPAVSKVPAKKVPAAKALPAAKKVAAAKPAPAAKKLGSPTKTGKFTIEVRPSIEGKKVRLGYASSEAEKAKMIAAYKASV